MKKANETIPLTEKTIELNVTAELLSVVWGRTHRAPIATGLSLKDEPRFSYDFRIDLAGRPFFIQFKRAYRTGHEFHYRINFNKEVDQHDRLLIFERFGFGVAYCLPMFDDMPTLGLNRVKLLDPQSTLWIRPSNLKFSPNYFGHHNVIYDTKTRRIRTHSNLLKQKGPFSFNDFWNEMLAKGEFGRDDFSTADFERVHSALNNFRLRKTRTHREGQTQGDRDSALSDIKHAVSSDDDLPAFGSGLTAISLLP